VALHPPEAGYLEDDNKQQLVSRYRCGRDFCPLKFAPACVRKPAPFG
jgi:hypothetical protein